jgi:hypothetical protein
MLLENWSPALRAQAIAPKPGPPETRFFGLERPVIPTDRKPWHPLLSTTSASPLAPASPPYAETHGPGLVPEQRPARPAEGARVTSAKATIR